MTGVSYMIPFVAAGGLLIALGFLFGGYEIVGPYGQIAVKNTIFTLPDAGGLKLEHVLGGTGFFASGFFAYIGSLFFIIGKTAFALFIPAFAGYVAYAIADRPGIAPGFIMGGLAANLFNVTAADGTALPATGFLGAIVGGVLAGLIAHWIASWRVPTWARGLMPVMVIPLLTSIIAGFIMIVVLGKPIYWVMTELNRGLNNMSGSSAVLLGMILGLMMAFDMGGPLNKVAYVFATAGIGVASLAADAPQLKIMASVDARRHGAPIALALSTVLRPNLFTVAERENGKAGWLLGASFITEGAIPFAAADPLRVIPPIMLGSAVTGALSEAFNVGIRAPHGGIFVIFAVHNIPGYLVSLAAGVRRRSDRGDLRKDGLACEHRRRDRLTRSIHAQQRRTHAHQVRRSRFGRRPARPARRDHLRGGRRARLRSADRRARRRPRGLELGAADHDPRRRQG